ncbi:hypothetical protein [Streptomyces sp. E1N211]|uniref:hypothetical protein n=1 Tax=Streptomyces sp. E1N211 TaxID=1851876 RepID=UPI001F4EA1D9|nr:hypothetical protein [Streptomyces sp. E1N211]
MAHDAQAGTVLTVVHEPDGAAPGSALVFELCGPLGTAQAEAVAAQVATRHRAYCVALEGRRGGPPAAEPGRRGGGPGPGPRPPRRRATCSGPPGRRGGGPGTGARSPPSCWPTCSSPRAWAPSR